MQVAEQTTAVLRLLAVVVELVLLAAVNKAEHG